MDALKKMLKKIPIKSIIEVDWVDAVTLEPKQKKTNWIKTSVLRKHCNKLLVIKSVGRLVCFGEFYLALAMSEKNGDCHLHSLIPLSAIIELRSK